MRALDLTGMRFGKLVVVALTHKGKKRKWLCKCDCGGESTVTASNLRSGHATTCGCGVRAAASRNIRRISTTHGASRTPTYRSYRNMIHRCYSPSDPSYQHYGAKGIKVCDRWRHSFENFLSDMGKRKEGMSLDRIDNAKGYSPENCRWADSMTQQNNRRTTQFLEFGGRRLSLGQWAAETGIPFGVLSQRVKLGWATERALTEPARKLRRTAARPASA